MAKYIIKNCPAYKKDALDFCFAINATQAICYNCTDCVMKQIYKTVLNPALIGGIDETAEKILDLLSIQEVE